MTTIAERKKIAKLVMTINDDKVINKIKEFLEEGRKAAREKFIEEYNREIDEAEAEMDRGEFYTQKQVEVFFEKWKKEKLAGVKKPKKILKT